MSAARVAVIGLGRMGGPIADRIIDAGHDVAVFDIAADAVAARVERGARGARSAADAARDAEFLQLVVFDDDQAVSSLTSPEGALDALAGNAVVSIHTTVSLDTIDALATCAEARGVTVIDAGISGGEKGAAAGTLLTMVGGDAVTVERARPILATFSKEVLHAGPRGAGMALKLARNAACYTMMAAFHEAIELAHGSGVDIAELRRVIEETDVFGMAPAPFQIGGPRPLPDDAPAPLRAVLEHTLRLAEKDFEQSVALARRIGADVPVLETAHRTFARVVRL